MQTINEFVKKSIRNHLLKIEDSNYHDIETILGQEKLGKLTYYLKICQDDKFSKLLEEILTDAKIQTELQRLLTPDLKDFNNFSIDSISKDIDFTQGTEEENKNPDGKTSTVFYGTNREPIYPNDHSKGNIDLLELGHGYFASHKLLLNDICQLINFNLDADNRQKLIALKNKEGKPYWKLKVK